ncbi:hypothetical protein SAMD00019534_017020 [Acytostelium subglobosum LB1]|uniref:hypothetical protein n=1 Tax=Acytostelium subglobosum LB1 TaxID=1410327 RepID=UPI000644EDCB|nr:hypothetical protein SAMD00019534_017020 [Acytostelium subglobosum LB1]GAM18527.1 hypothetical protein SAMD00019534_017020 [Acytostelium subglobosum LB1]|eukprot:XP_012757747.1 hypothetical protein SAMD00019534_017020 [Acytostelium subglobosum LB1]
MDGTNTTTSTSTTTTTTTPTPTVTSGTIPAEATQTQTTSSTQPQPQPTSTGNGATPSGEIVDEDDDVEDDDDTSDEIEKSTPILSKKEGGNGSTKLIVCVDGGGIRGIIAVRILMHLESHLGFDLISKADLLGGTSTGGLLTFTRAQGMSYEAAEELYKKMSKIIFGGFFQKVKNFLTDECLGDMVTYERELNRIFGNTSLNEFKRDQKIFTLTSSISENETSYVTNVWGNYRQTTATVAETMRGTSAAPPYFTPVYFDGRKHMDGGLMANNPVFKAKEEADDLYNDGTKYIIVSIGTGYVKNNVSKPPKHRATKLIKEGYLSPALFKTLANAIGNSHSLHKEFKASIHGNPNVIYHRFDVLLDQPIALDEHSSSSFKKMYDMSKQYVEMPKTKDRCDRLKRQLQSLFQPKDNLNVSSNIIGVGAASQQSSPQTSYAAQ